MKLNIRALMLSVATLASAVVTGAAASLYNRLAGTDEAARRAEAGAEIYRSSTVH